MNSPVSRTRRVLPRPQPGSWPAHGRELALYLGLYLGYLAVRALTPEGDALALANARRIVALEKSLGLFYEPVWQQWALTNAQALVTVMGWVYVITYWPVILLAALLLYLFRRADYRRYRRLMVAHLCLALTVFAWFPLAPPFKTDYLVDTIGLLGPGFYGGPAMTQIYNTNAAMPSLHFGWSVIFGWLFLRELPGWYKLAGPAYPLLTLAAIIITGNHYIVDAVAGTALIGAAWMVLAALRRWRKIAVRSCRRATVKAAPD